MRSRTRRYSARSGNAKEESKVWNLASQKKKGGGKFGKFA